MRQINDRDLNRVMSQIDQSMEHIKAQLEQGCDTDQYRFLRIFRDHLVEQGIERERANKIAAGFEIELSNGVLDDNDITNAAQQYAEWIVQMFNILQEAYEGDDLMMEFMQNPGLSLKL